MRLIQKHSEHINTEMKSLITFQLLCLLLAKRLVFTSHTHILTTVILKRKILTPLTRLKSRPCSL
jgi:hypothetical protein